LAGELALRVLRQAAPIQVQVQNTRQMIAD
jgi:hypothetical protein